MGTHCFIRQRELSYEDMFIEKTMKPTELYESIQKEIEREIERLNPLLMSLLPVLHTRLKEKYNDGLNQWLERGESKGVKFKKDKSAIDFIDEIEERAAEVFYLDMDGWEGIGIARLFSTEDKERLRQTIESISPVSALKDLIKGVQKGEIAGQEKENAVFFIYGAMNEDGVPEEVQSLWILESGLTERYGYMFELENGAGLNPSWRLCVDILPAEVVPVLDMDYI